MTDTVNNNEEELFGRDDFVFTRTIDEETGKPVVVGGGYKVNSIFLQEGIPSIKTYNSPDQNGGKVSSPFDNLAVPAGLFYINQRIPKKDYDTSDIDKYYKKHEMLSDDMVDKLFGLVEADKKRKRKTRKQNIKPINKQKTRRYH
jgi:hypothetical protein